ncbi:acyl-CoA Delta(11) desaturase-like [Cimex lectularius]|uniref:Fatty acid desaturase n=1 Tax=Cimex lectularius TaxID=79782 RepID=A0A8I6RYY7_CIMLE|nr:acyl-CoA Delta(11) desaturase-like [Cimex lectularius]XP_014252774.1 acyl-CoA Delta(11) desaturase-like [Cimex lectularius]XP_014252775.1 acyl-CoA Delta(11) desaturase-like [Cimex lectularius]
MAPNMAPTPDNSECTVQPLDPLPEKKQEYKVNIVWRNVALFAYLHLAAVYGLYLMLFEAKWLTVFFALVLYKLSALGITAGAHRLWAHKSYKAKLPLKVFLVAINTLAFQNHVIEWARDHRVHHKFSETDADPHNATRGFFFSHIGWLLCRKHPELKEKGKLIDISDLENDPVLAFQKKYYLILMPLTCFLFPTLMPMYMWGESLKCSWFTATMFRYALTLNVTWLVNSAAHMWGQKPYDASISPVENLAVSLGAAGEGWHNYHHVFPWDYKAAELGNYRANTTTALIDLMAKIGWAYDLKTVPPEIVEKRSQRTGDGTRPLWGWGDKDMTQEDAEGTVQLLNTKCK